MPFKSTDVAHLLGAPKIVREVETEENAPRHKAPFCSPAFYKPSLRFAREIDSEALCSRMEYGSCGTAGSSGKDRKSVVEGKSVSERVDLGGRRFIKKQNTTGYVKRNIK